VTVVGCCRVTVSVAVSVVVTVSGAAAAGAACGCPATEHAARIVTDAALATINTIFSLTTTDPLGQTDGGYATRPRGDDVLELRIFSLAPCRQYVE
jgi:Flp pilus assembly protein TadG